MKLYQNERWLRIEYVSKRKTAKQIADECKVSEKTIWMWLSKYKLIKDQRRLS